ncbi:Septin and tuftelin-interacting protein 1 [Chlorella vulgaris]
MAHLDEDQHHERLDMDNDFEGGEFIGGEFFHRGQRKRKPQTAEDRLYGIFAEDSDDERDGKRRGGLGGGGKRADYSKPVSFVGGGVVQHGPQEGEQAQHAQQGQQEQQAAAANGQHRPGLGAGGGGLGFAPASSGAGVGAGAAAGGLGFGPANAPAGNQSGIGFSAAGGGGGIGFAAAGSAGGGGGLGFAAAGGAGGGLGFAAAGSGGAELKFARGHATLQQEEEEEEEEVLLPTAFGRRIQQAAEQRRKQGEQAVRVERAKTKAAMGPKDVGQFEAHTRGIGAKLLSKMGWQEGEGLGRDKRGIAKPLEAKLRPKGMGMGFGDYTEHKLVPEGKAAEEAAAAAKDKEPETVDVKREAKMWKRKNADQRVKRSFKTADEVLKESESRPVAAERQTIIDMRGPQARLVTNLEHLNVEEDRGDGGTVPMPELQHNMRLLVDLAENDIQKLDAKIRHEKDTAVILGKEQARLEEEAAAAAAAAERLEGVLAAVARAHSEAGLELGDLAEVYRTLRGQYREEYVMYNLAAAALAQVLPRMAQLLQLWSPLQDPGLPLAQFAAWRPLLESEGARQGSVLGGGGLELAGGGDAYMRLVAELVLPPLRKDLANSWDPRDAAQLERFVEAWEPLLPAAALQYIMESLVLPQLRLAVQAWDPLRDTVALHTWVHPWLPFLGLPMAELWPVIRFKFASALQAWHPSDQSAHVILAPWHKVFERKDWEQLLGRSIVPKLAFALQELVINPLHQELEPFQWVLSWQDVMPLSQMAALFEQYFFPKWHAVLRHWLANNPNYDEVTRWYLGWKSLFPQDLLHQERVRVQMSAALNMMNSAADGGPPPSSWSAPPPDGPAVVAPPAAALPMHYDASDLTLRQLVEQYAEEAGVTFLPKPGRTYEGLQMYGFGLVSCVVDNAKSSVQAQMGDLGWTTVSLEQLQQEHERRSAAKQKGGRKSRAYQPAPVEKKPEVNKPTASTQAQAASASPALGQSLEDLLAESRASCAHAEQVLEETDPAARLLREQKAQAAATGQPHHTQPLLPAALPYATSTAPPWPPAAGSTPACRTAAAEASAAAALVWAASAMGLEAKAEGSAARAASRPAAERTHVALEWQAAAAAWRAAFEQLEYARQADPQASAVQQTEQSIRDMRGFKRQCQHYAGIATAWQLPKGFPWWQPAGLPKRGDQLATTEQAKGISASTRREEARAEVTKPIASTQVQAASASPALGQSLEDLLAESRASCARAEQVLAESDAAARRRRLREQKAQAAATGQPHHTQPLLPAALPYATSTAPPWPPAAGSTPACRTAAAEASAAAALVWAASAMGLEAKAEGSAARAASRPAAERTHVALEWQAAAAAWRAAFEQLEYARQADPQASAVQQTEQSIRDMRGFKRQCQHYAGIATAWQLPKGFPWWQPAGLPKRGDQLATTEQAKGISASTRREEARAEVTKPIASTQVQAASASPALGQSLEDLLAESRASCARAEQVLAESDAAARRRRLREQKAQAAATGQPHHTQPLLPAALPYATSTAPPWPPAAGSTPACRTAAAEASAAAALVWAASAMGLEAKAEGSAARAASRPAAERTHVALEWQAAAAAWRAAFEQLEYARQADPQASAVQQTEQSIRDMRGFKRQCQQRTAAARPDWVKALCKPGTERNLSNADMGSTAEEMLALPTPKDLQALKLKLKLTLTTCSLKAAPHLTALNLWTNCNSATVPLVALQCLQRSDLSEWPGTVPEQIKKAASGQRADFPDGIEECGTDALRFALVAYTSQGRDSKLYIKRVVSYRHWCSKLWNAIRFAMINLGTEPSETLDVASFPFASRWILSKLNAAVATTVKGMEAYEFSAATSAVYSFWQYKLCDVFIELMKPMMALDDAAPGAAAAKQAMRDTLWVCLETGLRLLHPFMLLVTEELWQRPPGRQGQQQAASIMVADYPVVEAGWSDEQVEAGMAYLLLVVNKTRSLRSDYELTPKQRPPMLLSCKDGRKASLLASCATDITTLTTSGSLEVLQVHACSEAAAAQWSTDSWAEATALWSWWGGVEADKAFTGVVYMSDKKEQVSAMRVDRAEAEAEANLGDFISFLPIMSTRKIAVCGATGKQGGGVVAALQQIGGFYIRALTRNPDSPSSKKLAGPDVEVVKADFEDPASLKEAFAGCDAAFAVTDFWVACKGDGNREVKQGKNLVDAAKAAGLKHFVFSSLEDTRPALAGSREPLDASGRTVPHFDAKAEVEQYARAQLPGIASFIFPGVFYENLLPGSGMDPVKQEDGTFLLAQPAKNKMVWNATADIGKVAAAVIAAGPAEYGDKTVGVNGDELSLAEAAEVFTRVFGKQVSAVTPPLDDWTQMVVGFGVPEPMAKDLANMFLFYDTVDMRELRPKAAARKLVPDAVSLEDWLTANKEKYAQHFA